MSLNTALFMGIDSFNRFPLQVVGNKTLMLDGVGDVSLCMKRPDEEDVYGDLVIPG